MSKICFKAKVFKIGSWNILSLPKAASEKLPSRGMVMVQGTLNGLPFQEALEPDGKGSHWFRVSEALSEGDAVELSIEPMKEWPEPTVPSDLKTALTAYAEVHSVWMDITPMARWEWIRWIASTNHPVTRQRRIENTCEMLKAGKRRPCCFNRNLCSETSVSKNGVLLDFST